MRNLFIIPIILLLVACSSINKNDKDKNSLYGGTLRVNENKQVTTLFPPTYKDIASSHVISQIHAGLVKFDTKTLAILPSIATDWELDNSGMVYTFHLNPEAYFHDNNCFPDGKGRKITAQDFKYTFTYLATQNDKNKNFFGTVDKIKGAKEYYKASATDSALTEIDGIKILDDSTLQLTLDEPSQRFLQNIANAAASVLAKEAVDKGIEHVGAGPFYIDNYTPNATSIVLLKNENFYLTDNNINKLPYLDSIKISFIGSTKTELRMFVDNEIDAVFGLPNDYIVDFLSEYIEQFEAKPPVYILSKVQEGTIQQKRGQYNLYHSFVRNLHTNYLDKIDFSTVYLKEPSIEEEQFK
ncbi:MAG: ABC transporter substrate-binding protein [Bacteroidales bacterium]|nr:ABC transporter substrate-binding protein [Bacteroidales bacterium]